MDHKITLVYLLFSLSVFVICTSHQSDSFNNFRTGLSRSSLKNPHKSWTNWLSKRRNNFIPKIQKYLSISNYGKINPMARNDSTYTTYLDTDSTTYLDTDSTTYITQFDPVLVTASAAAIAIANDSTLTSTTNMTQFAPVLVTASAAAIAIALSVAIPAGINSIRRGNLLDDINFDETLNFNNGFDNQDPVPENNFDIPVEGFNFPDDGCGDGSIRFGTNNGTCHSVLKRGPCQDPRTWMTVDPLRLEGRCTPRLCGRRRVFVGRDGLCHDINDPFECRGGRRLYYTAFGDPICDCPIGQYPFPNANDRCVPLFTQGPCPAGSVVSIDPLGRLGCLPNQCQSIDGRDNPFQQLIPNDDGFCYPLGSRGPCPAVSQLLGYDIFERQSKCVDLQDPSSPYFSSPQEDQLIDNIYNQYTAEYGDIQAVLIKFNRLKRNDTAERRQEINTLGVFQVPGSLPEPLLHPCRPGQRRAINYKCTNPLLSQESARELLPAARSLFRCPSRTVLQATAQCVNDNRAANCGPSYRFNQFTGQCRSIF